MNGLFSSLLSLISGGSAQVQQLNAIQIQTAVGDLAAAVAAPHNHIRMYVDSGGGKGQQMAAVRLLDRLLAPVNPPVNPGVPGLGFAGAVDMVYADGAESTLTNLVELLGWQAGTTRGQYGNATLTLIPFSQRGKLGPAVTYGFSGASDPNTITAADLKVTYYLRLQPFQYSHRDELVFSDGTASLDLATVAQLGGASFHQRGVYIAPPALPFNWGPYLNDPDHNKARRVGVLQWLIANMGGAVNPFRLLVVYGVTNVAENALGSDANSQVAEIVLGVMASQRTLAGAARPGALPAVIVNLSRFEALGGAAANMTFGGVTSLLAKGVTPLEMVILRNPDNPQLGAVQATIKARDSYLDRAQASHRTSFLVEPTAQQTQTQVQDWLLGIVPPAPACPASQRVLWVQLGPIPPPAFDYVLLQSDLPPVFEGNNTANVALNSGRPYYHANRPGDRNTLYPSLTLAQRPASRILTTLQAAADQVTVKLGEWGVRARDPDYPPEIFGAPIAAWQNDPNSLVTAYFRALQQAYSQPANDKFSLALVYLAQRSIAPPQPQLLARAADGDGADPGPLDALYLVLRSEYDADKHTLDIDATKLPATIGAALIAMSAANVDLTSATLARDPATGSVTSITAAGTTSFLGHPAVVALAFAAPEGALNLEITWTWKEKGQFGGLDWIQLRDPSVTLTVYEAGGLSFGQASATVTIGSEPIKLSWRLASPGGGWLVRADIGGDHPPSLSDAFQLAAGRNLSTTLPAPLNTITKLALASIEVDYDPKTATTSSVTFVVRSQDDTPVPLVGQVSLGDITITTTVQSPTEQPSLAVQAGGTFTIAGHDKDPAVIDVGVGTPDLTFTGSLESGKIGLVGLLTAFAVTTPVDLPGDPQLTEFAFNYNRAQQLLSVSVALGLDWSIPQSSPIFTIEELSLQVTSAQAATAANLLGRVTLLKNSASPIRLDLGADYLGPDAGWTFSAKETDNGVKLGALLHEYLGWTIEQDLAIGGLGFTVSTGDGSWLFTGETVGPWTVPFIDLDVKAKARIGRNGTKSVAAALPEVTSSSLAAAEPVTPGPFGRVEVELAWNGFDITVWYDYAPKATTYGITWGDIQGTVTGPNSNQDYVATLSLKDGVTVGSLIEDLVSKLRGSRFSLEAPWSILDDISLSGVALTYTFNRTDSSRNAVGLKVSAGPIELGFARIDSIDIQYRSTGADRGVMVTLTGSFPWNVGGANGDAGSLGPWDASKPGAAPAPPGQGGKYLDLRMLAMGQHIGVTGLTDAQTVQQAIEKIETLPAPTPGKVPGVVYDTSSDWFVATNLGILRQGDDRSTTYLIALQLVFNDPRLYGLRVKLDGDAAKVLKGLDFQVMYRQITDTLGVYQGEITLPDVMRYLTVGAYSLTLPVFGFAVYTNGDFLIDVGFPHNMDWSRSLTVQGIVYPGIPVTGSAGFYFGELPAAATNKVPAADNGTFNPIVVFGFALQVGVGKSVQYGPLSAGFSITVVGVLEGVIAKWNPYPGSELATTGDSHSQVQGAYYFWLQGTVGIAGQLYGSVDFAIVKAQVNVAIGLYVQLAYESFVSLAISVIASVDVSITVKIDLWLFSISLHFSFSMRLKETFTLDNHGTTPWHVSGAPSGTLRAPADRRLRARRALALAANASDAPPPPDWTRLAPTTDADLRALTGQLLTGLAAAQDEWQTAPNPAAQLPCYVTLMSLDSVAPAGHGDGTDQADTSFEKLAKRMLGWAVAAVLPGSGQIAWSDLQTRAVSQDELTRLIEDVLLSTGTAPTPWPDDQLDTFMNNQFQLTVSIPPMASDSPAAVFPVPPGVALSAPAYGSLPALSYTLAGYNQISATVLAALRAQFAQMLVQTEQESGAKAEVVRDNGASSVAAWVFADYFLLIARQMAQAARDALRSFAYQLSNGATAQDAVTWLARNGATVAASDLLLANAQAPLAAGSGNAITVGIVTEPGTSTSFTDFASTLHGVDSVDLALANVPRPVLATGAVVAYPGKPPYTAPAGATLVDAAVAIGVGVGDLVSAAGLVGQTALLSSSACVLVPAVTHTALAADTFASLATSGPFAGCFAAGDLATANAGRPVLRAGTKVTVGADVHVVASGESLADVARTLGIVLSALVADTGTLGLAGLIAPGAVLVLPPFTRAVAVGDTLASVAAAYGTSVAVLADSGNAGATFAVDATHTTLAVPHLDQLGFGALAQEIQNSNGLAHLSGMVSRYQLHGLRLTTAGIAPQALGMWVHDNAGQLSLPPEAGLHALTGQQFPVPVVQDDDYVVTLDRTGVSWMTFESGATRVDQLTVTITTGSREATAINALSISLAKGPLDVTVTQLGAAPMASVAAASFPFTAAAPWQATDTVALPYGPPPSGVQSLRLWQVPDALQALPNPATRDVNPRLAVLVDRYDEATGATVSSPVGAHGWGSAVTVTVKRVPAVAGSRAWQTTYEVVGAYGKDLLLLERLLDQLQGDDAAVAQIAVGYAPDASSNSSVPGIQTDPLASMTLGIAQTDLSTLTNPPGGALLAARGAAPAGRLLNTPTELLRLVWEASITRSEGFYLYYYDGDTAAGLPDRIFNDRGEAEITLLALYAQSGGGFGADEVTDYMNVLTTGASLDLSNAVVVARSDPPTDVTMPTSARASLGEIATGTFSDLGELAAANATLPLGAGVELPITQGVYQAPPGGIALAAVATRFATTVAALQAANGGALPDPIGYPAALRLPSVTLTSTGSGDTATLAALSAATGEDLTALGADLADVAGLFADGGQIAVTGGPRVRTATVPPGAASFGAQRAVPATAPSDPTDPTFAPLFLEHASSLLGIAIAANAGFDASGAGLPAGPTYQRDDPTVALRVRTAAGEDQPWSYAASLPYATYVKGASTASPYHGVGQILQVDFAWQDAYGNRVVTTLSDPQTGDSGPANQPPLLAGYSDALVALSQWPSTSASWTMSGGPTAPAIDLLLSFATARYEGVLMATATAATTVSVVFTEALDPTSAATTSHYTLDGGVTVSAAAVQSDGITVALTVTPALTQEQNYTLTVAGVATKVQGGDVLHGHAGFAYPDVPDQRTSSVAADATHDLGVYTRLVGQLQDPLGVALALDTSLLDAGRVALPQAAVAGLTAWLGTPTTAGSVLGYLTDRAAQHDTVQAPAATTTLTVPLDPAGITSRHLFELTTSLVITRTGGTVLGDLATVAGIRETATAVTPMQQPVGDDQSTLGLVAFADAFEQALSQPGDHAYKVATGIDRAQPTSAASGVWAVRLGLTSGQGIRFTVAPAASAPVVLSPRPASTSLIHRTISIRPYVRSQGLEQGVPTQFTGIDFDTWCRQLFAALDGVLSPGLTAPIQILGALVGTDYLATLLDQKEALAAAAKLWMVPVFEDQASADAGDAQDAFYQQMLSRLSNAYAIRAAVQLDAAVTADVSEALADQPPRLFGPVVPSSRVFLAATLESQSATAVTLSFSGPLSATPAGQPANYTVSGGVTVSVAVLSSDGRSVTLTTTMPVVPGTTTVTVSAAVVTTDGESLVAPLVRTVMPSVSTVAASTITLSSPKLTLATAAAQPLTFLVTAPEVTRGADGEVIPSLTLDLEYDGSSIEHQIGSLAGIEGYLASSWLSFVTAAGTEPLRAELGPIEVPLPLRAFPATPTLTEQSGTGSGDPQGTLDQRTRWDYRATYQLPFHYPQDVIHGRVEFNLRDLLAASDGFMDALGPIAQLVSVLPALQADLDGIVATIDATTTTASDGQAVADAKIAMDALTAMLTDIVTAVGDNALTAAPAAASRAGTASLTYPFEIAESAVTVDTTPGAQLVTLKGALPANAGKPRVDIPGWTAQTFEPPGAAADDVRHFVYKRAGTGGMTTYLLNANAQTIPQRTLVLPSLDVLERQDAQTTIWLERNRDLVAHRPTADAFVYKTPEVTFTNPLHPTIVGAEAFDIGSLSFGSAPLADHLTNLLTALLIHNVEPELTFQLEVTYAYSLNALLSVIPLPVFLQPPLTVTTGQTTGTDSSSVQAMAADWAAAITTWFTGTVPLGAGNLQFDLTVMSNLTAKPMPLLGLPALYLPLSRVSPPLPTRSS